MNPPSSRSHPPPWSRYLAALGVLPTLALAAFGFFALRREAALARIDAQSQATTLAQVDADRLASALFTLPLTSGPEVEAWNQSAGQPEAEPLARLHHLRPGLIARFVSSQATYPPQALRPTIVQAPDPASRLAAQWNLAVQQELSSRASEAATSAWQTTFDLAQGHPSEPIVRFRLGSALGRLGRVPEARNLLESLIHPPTSIAGETGLPLDVLTYRALLQIADSDPQASQEASAWYDGLAQRVLLHWQLPEALLLEASPPAAQRLRIWQEIAKLHEASRQAFLNVPTQPEPGSPTWFTQPSTEPHLLTFHPVDGGVWQVHWPESTLKQTLSMNRASVAAGVPPAVEGGVSPPGLPGSWPGSMNPAPTPLSTTDSVILPGYLGRIVSIAGRQFPPTLPGEPLATATSSTFPALSVTLTLAHPDILDARQRRKTWIFATLIKLATLVTLGAFLATFRASERQRQLALQQSEFVAAVSHELRAPLAAVRLLAEELIDLPSEHAPRREEYHRLILREARRLGLLVDNVLRHSRLERRGPELDRVPIDLSQHIASVVEALQPTAQERNVSFEVQLPDAPVEAHADPQAFTQILVNLIDNALKHSPPSSTVTISVSQSMSPPIPRLAVVRVQDHGPGIPAADHARIFEAFVRRGSELRRETPGVGLGLAIVRQLVHAHQGRIRVDSQPGHGACFTVELPLEPQPA
jgi:signal transduction histidine kinase